MPLYFIQQAQAAKIELFVRSFGLPEAIALVHVILLSECSMAIGERQKMAGRDGVRFARSLSQHHFIL